MSSSSLTSEADVCRGSDSIDSFSTVHGSQCEAHDAGTHAHTPGAAAAVSLLEDVEAVSAPCVTECTPDGTGSEHHEPVAVQELRDTAATRDTEPKVLQGTVSRLRGTLSICDAEVQELHCTVVKLQRTLEAKTQELEDIMATHDAKVKYLQGTVSRLQRMLPVSDAEVQELHGTVFKLQRTLEAQAEELEDTACELACTRTNHDAEAQGLRDTISELRSAATVRSATLRELQRTTAAQSVETQLLQGTIAARNAEVEELQRTVSRLQCTVSTQEAEVKELHSTAATQNAEMQLLRRTVTTRNAELEELQHTVSRLQGTLPVSDAEVRELQNMAVRNKALCRKMLSWYDQFLVPPSADRSVSRAEHMARQCGALADTELVRTYLARKWNCTPTVHFSFLVDDVYDTDGDSNGGVLAVGFDCRHGGYDVYPLHYDVSLHAWLDMSADWEACEAYMVGARRRRPGTTRELESFTVVHPCWVTVRYEKVATPGSMEREDVGE